MTIGDLMRRIFGQTRFIPWQSGVPAILICYGYTCPLQYIVLFVCWRHALWLTLWLTARRKEPDAIGIGKASSTTTTIQVDIGFVSRLALVALWPMITDLIPIIPLFGRRGKAHAGNFWFGSLMGASRCLDVALSRNLFGLPRFRVAASGVQKRKTRRPLEFGYTIQWYFCVSAESRCTHLRRTGSLVLALLCCDKTCVLW